MSEEKPESTVSVRKSCQYFDQKPVELIKNTRRTSLVPAIFLAAEQENGPVKRNFSIPSKQNSIECEKITGKFDERKKSSFHTNSFNSALPVYSSKRGNNS